MNIFRWIILGTGLMIVGCGSSGGGGDAMEDTASDTDSKNTGDTATGAEDTNLECVTHSEQRCFEGDVYWYDSCGEKEEIIDECAASNGECVDVDGLVKTAECRCLYNFYGDECDSCPPNYGGDNCDVCSNQWEGDLCNKCPGNFDSLSNCESCRNRWIGDDCETCTAGFDAEQDCSVCANKWIGDNCDACPGNWDENANCGACEAGWAGEDCEICVVYVDVDASAGGDGQTWSGALNDLQAGIDIAEQEAATWNSLDTAGGHVCEVWIAEGTYFVYGSGDNADSRDDTIELKTNAHVYGGFAGDEVLREARNFETQPVIIDGHEDDSRVLANRVFHVVTGADGAVLDSVVITGGRSDYAALSTPAHTDSIGTGYYAQGRSASLSNVVFINNDSLSEGVVYLENTASELFNLFILDNQAEFGAGIYATSGDASIVSNCYFVGNSASSVGGALEVIDCSSTAPVVKNSVFLNNTATKTGGAVVNSASSLEVLNCTFYANNAATGPAIYSADRAPSVKNSILWNSAARTDFAVADVENDSIAFSNSDVNLQVGNGNICTDPGYVGEFSTGTVGVVNFEGAKYQTVISDDSAAWTVDELAGLFLKVGDDWFYIISNTDTSLRVWGDVSATVSVNDAYSLFSFRLTEDAAAKDAGKLDTRVKQDIEGNWRVDDMDMGAYEY